MRACLTFYKTLAFPLIGISVICGQQVWAAHSAYFVFRVLWVKVLTSVVIGSYIWNFRSEQFVFYNNLGYSQARLFLLSFGLDFVIWLLIILGVVIFL
jgi:hypothetical protein